MVLRLGSVNVKGCGVVWCGVVGYGVGVVGGWGGMAWYGVACGCVKFYKVALLVECDSMWMVL